MSELHNAEFLTPEELSQITGYKLTSSQRQWLDRNGWVYVLNASGRPVVSRWYARLKLSGVTPTENGLQASWRPDFSGIN
jgi:hypothetical protein